MRLSLHRLLLLLSDTALPGFALAWKTKQVTIQAAPFQTTQDVVFEFTNDRAQPVTVLDVRTSCDCLAAQADRKIYPPGASGSINARFTIGERSGHYERTISLLTDASTEPETLRLEMDVPELATLIPRSVSWSAHEPPDDKTVEITPATGLEIIFTEAQATNDDFTARLETIAAGRHYRLHIHPRDTARPASAAIRIFGHDKAGHEIIVSAYPTVR